MSQARNISTDRPVPAGSFGQICQGVGFGLADAAILQELAAGAREDLRRIGVEFSSRVTALARTARTERRDDARVPETASMPAGPTDWLIDLFAEPTEERFRQAARQVRLTIPPEAPAWLLTTALGPLQIQLGQTAMRRFTRHRRKQQQALQAVCRAAAILLALATEGANPAGTLKAPRPLGGACLVLGGEQAYQQTLAKALLDSAPLGILAYDLYGRITVCNTRVYEILGHDLQTGADLRQWLDQALEDPQDRQEAELHFAASFSSELDESASDTTLRIRRPDGGERVISLSTAPVRTPSGKSLGGITVIADITQQQRLEQNLIRAERLAAIGELAASLAHEIKNPLAGIGGAMEIIRERFRPDDPHREIIDEIQHQIERLDSTVRDLLVYARPTPPDKMPTNVQELIDAVLTVLARERQLQPLQIIKHYPDTPLELSVDPDQLEQVFMNIVLNAAQAMMKPGQLVIRLTAEDGWCRVSFADNGPGMPQEVARRVFEPFFTTKTRGTGLGLSICRKIIEAHGGRMELKTALGEGTTVTVNLPV